jgi:predicted phosphodiesterase
MPTSHPIAIACADLHLSLLQPVCRADANWLSVQAHYLDQLKDIAGDLPILCSGDIFDRWNAPPELINFVLKNLPDNMLCIPGQHDLPNHLMDQKHRSGYGVLVQAGKIVDLSACTFWNDTDFQVQGFGWDVSIAPPIPSDSIRIAAIHRYCWTKGHKYPDAPESANVSNLEKELQGYDIAVVGDNHKGFLSRSGKCIVCNVGGFIRRKSDEIDYAPSVGVIYSDGSVVRKPLDTSIDKFHDIEEQREEVPLNLKEFIDKLEGLGEHGLNFREAVENHLRTEDISPATKQIILKALETT